MQRGNSFAIVSNTDTDFDIQDYLEENECLVFLTQLHVHFDFAAYPDRSVKRLSRFCMEKNFDVLFPDQGSTREGNFRPVMETDLVDAFEKAVRAEYKVKKITREVTYPVIRTYDSSGNWERQFGIDDFRKHCL